MRAAERKPIEYAASIGVRFSDIDSYGHVNAQNYVDYVSTSRLNFMANEMKTNIQDVMTKGVGFFLVKSTINYRRPIVGLQTVLVKSHVSEIRGSRFLMIQFAISSADEATMYSDGVLEFSIVDLKTAKSMIAAPWVVDLFFEPPATES